MEETGQIPFSGLRKLNMEKTFKWGVRSLQTSWSKEEFSKAFPSFSAAEQECLFRLFVQVTTYLHESIEDDFEFLCLETQSYEMLGFDLRVISNGGPSEGFPHLTYIGTILDRIERLLEEKSMDPLFSNKTNVGEVGCDLILAKKNEIQYLTDMLEMAEEQKRQIRARIERLKKERK